MLQNHELGLVTEITLFPEARAEASWAMEDFPLGPSIRRGIFLMLKFGEDR